MKISGVALGVSILAFASSAYAQTNPPESKRFVDDFTQGQYASPAFRRGPVGLTSKSQSGSATSIIGGSRAERLVLCNSDADCAGANPFGQYSSYAIGASNGVAALARSSGYMDGSRFELSYGGGAPMHAVLGKYSRIRVKFSGLTEVLNFNVLAYTGTSWGQNACNVPRSGLPFTVEFPFSGFTRNPGALISFDDIGHLVFIFQSGSAIGGVSFGITAIEVSDTKDDNAIQCNLAAAP